uniref:Uncharacterized protein n=1 Tax=Cannabis sativa TaxID=3483 RepID=A0A803R6U7_CANSA
MVKFHPHLRKIQCQNSHVFLKYVQWLIPALAFVTSYKHENNIIYYFYIYIHTQTIFWLNHNTNTKYILTICTCQLNKSMLF